MQYVLYRRLTIVPPAVALWFSNFTSAFKHRNLFVGINGFAEFECEGNEKSITKNTEINFNDLTDLFTYQVEKRMNFSYEGTGFLYIYFNMKNKKRFFEREGMYNKNSNIKDQSIDFLFCRRTEQYWTVYLLDKMEEQLQKLGYLLFNIFFPEEDICLPYIKLAVGQITFINTKKEEFIYKFNEIKRMYSKGSDLHIEHVNFQRTLFFFKSGNENVIPMLHLCNRQFFYKAMELLLGYKI
jgi:hypothetical protein